MTSWYSQQKEKWLLKIKELEDANATLLTNNVQLASENVRLSRISKEKDENLIAAEKEKTECKQKCEVVISEKDRRIHVLEEYKANCKTVFERLKNGRWLYQVKQNQDGSIDIIHTVHPA